MRWRDLAIEPYVTINQFVYGRQMSGSKIACKWQTCGRNNRCCSTRTRSSTELMFNLTMRMSLKHVLSFERMLSVSTNCEGPTSPLFDLSCYFWSKQEIETAEMCSLQKFIERPYKRRDESNWERSSDFWRDVVNLISFTSCWTSIDADVRT